MYDYGSSAQSCTFPSRAFARGREFWRQISNPLAFGLLGLAVAVTVWGYGYKLSLYTVPLGTPGSRVPAKLWIEHRFGFSELSSSAAAPHVQPRIYAQADSLARFTAALELPFRSVVGLLPATAGLCAIPFFHAAIPLRSPPALTSF